MRISLSDRSLYLKGLMLLIRKDREIHDAERTALMRCGVDMGFDKKFCKETIRDILDNRHVVDEPPRFSDRRIARCFIRDGFRLSLIDKDAHEAELAWLHTVATANALEETFFADALTAVLDKAHCRSEGALEATRFEWE